MIRPAKAIRQRGFALLVVLAFVVLLTGLVVAYFTRTTNERQLATATSSQSAADELARSALEIVVGDIKQEIADGSSTATASAAYPPLGPANVVPARSGNPPDVPNLIRRSVRSDPIVPPGVPSRASAVASGDPSANGRFIDAARWNSHYLVPKANTSNDQPDPIPSFVAPDWVLVSRDGPSVRTGIGSASAALNNRDDANANYVIGRYAYAVYDEGGLLDINVAGFPSPTPAPEISGRKGTVAFADLTALPTTVTAINRIVGWRNYATVQPNGTFPAFTFTPSAVGTFVAHFLDRNRDFRSVAPIVVGSGSGSRTDQSFITRAELIRLRSSSLAGNANMLAHLGTFSRAHNRPTWQDAAFRLSTRFPLERFDNLIAPVAKAKEIKRFFGLVHVPASSGTPATPEHWQYHGANGTSVQSSIHVLNGNAQDPDLSVLLKYALPSLPDSEILSIMASLIDQVDTNDDTTWIEYGSPDPNSPPQRAYGVDRTASTQPGAPTAPANPTVINRGFRNVGEIGYAYKNGTTSVDFRTSGSVESALLDLFTFNTAATRAGNVNLNTRNPSVLAAILKGAVTTESSSAVVTNANAITAANAIVAATTAQPALGRQDVTRLASASVVSNTPFTTSEETRETIARALAELGQTRTWGLLIDVIAQSGRFPPNATSLAQFVVEGEKRYWLHIAIDRFTGEVIDQQLEAVYE